MRPKEYQTMTRDTVEINHVYFFLIFLNELLQHGDNYLTCMFLETSGLPHVHAYTG